MSTETPTVSIVTPSFNQARFLEQCIRSVLAQDYPHIEYIIIDGGSTDGSAEIIRRYGDKLAYWESAPDGGQADAINKGLRRASGQIVAWLNSDDLYFPTAVSTAVRRFREKRDLALFYGDCVFVDEEGGFVRYFTEVEPYDQHRLLNYSDYIMQPTAFFSRDTLARLGYLDESLHYAMDWDLWCRLSKAGAVHYEERPIAANRDYAATKTNSGGWRRLAELWELQRRHRTVFWPHAFWGYLAAEINLRSRRLRSRWARWLGSRAAMAVCHLSPSGVRYAASGPKNRHLYGLVPYSRTAPGGRVEIHLPLLAEDRFLEVTFDRAPGTRVFIDGQRLVENRYRVRGARRPVSLVVEFRREDGSYCPGRLRGLELGEVDRG